MLTASDTAEGLARSVGLGVLGFAQAFGRYRPDLLVVLGDRFEMLAAATAALPFNLPLVHIHGGEVTEGAIDDAMRHALTKFSHLHFASTAAHAARIRQLGEEPWRIHVAGALALDQLDDTPLLDRAALEARTGLDLEIPPLVVTFHPVTREAEATPGHAEELLAALEASGLPVVVTLPNADTLGRWLGARFRAWARDRPRTALVDNLGTQAYFSLLQRAAAVVGNSSSALLEAPSLGCPAVNIGTRQRGRTRGANVLDCGYGRAEILEAIRRATAPGFRAALAGTPNPYRQAGSAAQRILEVLGSVPLEGLAVKRFADLEGEFP
jgi:UDP-N-acetylglucosamine 2-epimerase (non-hydrolysing)/GDP/UDP-N,N'-diacetylbacillosamine 2-epimerase (hydrolysing)